MHWKRSRRILGDLKKVSLAVRRGRVTFACSPRPCGGCHTCWGGGGTDGKVIERLCLSPYVEKPLNSKVIKSFVPELRSRKCFSCFIIPMFYVYMLWTFDVRFTYLCMSYIFIYFYFPFCTDKKEGCPRGVMVKAMDCGIVVSEFVL